MEFKTLKVSRVFADGVNFQYMRRAQVKILCVFAILSLQQMFH